ncbi:ATP-dependent RNA helicase DBP4 [Suhomyces tanzawaensis NRRL Y-17324]|uniref:ATP-dependent RNA helicase n=1 Tax=Suhomyces tanzawaensis NRRL Y-17324 TaxID=984487 RepID=A0A1E4SHJ1_9ASCO|nr:ATP-dependent RNA helicase DBP4 [Suhomyces tanzawaensis NRRL Y-17324]ODV78978.1 ATP-dependent RNA helicase DBP4 [Suhomyces tanzawaensis NRRL Y-17324]
MPKSKKQQKVHHKLKRALARDEEEEVLKKLERRIDEYDPAKDEDSMTQFEELPITEQTLKGLKEASFVKMTEIQKKTIPIALKGEDLMSTAKTGSGKTLAFLVPTIELLIRNKTSEYDGLTALIVLPTRELSVQIFEVLTKIGKYNNFSAGLVIGGKDFKFEKDRISKMNILIGTPGRISQHLNESVGLEVSNFQVLVLDEADRCLDMGFKKQIDNIIGHLPASRQTMLFSATQTDNIKDLARLSLTNPRRIGGNTLGVDGSDSQEVSLSSIPETLSQFYIRIPLDEKLDVLWSFIKSHLKSKILVFFSSSKQVQYTYETFRQLQPGISLLKLYGRNKQTTRLETITKFARSQHSCLFATDIVARGLDFPTIDWVIQVDCPEDAATYVHRVGRCARFGRKGNSLAMLLPSEEEGMLARLKANKIEPKFMNIKSKNKKSIRPQLQSLCFKDPILKNLGQRAFISYYRSIFVQKDKDIFKIDALPTEKFAASLGLPGAPKIKIKGGQGAKEKKNMSRKLVALEQTNDDGEEANDKGDKVRTKYDRMFERKNQTVLSDHYLNLAGTKKAQTQAEDEEDDSDDDFMKVKRKDHDLNLDELPDLNKPVSKRAEKKALSKKMSLTGNATKLKFDDDGVAHPLYELEDEDDFKAKGSAKDQKESFVSKETVAMNEADIEDMLTVKEKKKEKKRRRKEMERRMNESSDDEDANIEQDMEYSSGEEPDSKKPKWFQNDKHVKKNDDVLEIDEPETLEDLESLTQRLLQE